MKAQQKRLSQQQLQRARPQSQVEERIVASIKDYDLRMWKFAQLRDTINTSCGKAVQSHDPCTETHTNSNLTLFQISSYWKLVKVNFIDGYKSTILGEMVKHIRLVYQMKEVVNVYLKMLLLKQVSYS